MNLSPSKVKYVLAVYELSANLNKQVHGADIARKLHVSRPSVSAMLDDLVGMGLITKTEDGVVSMTDEGDTLIVTLYEQYRILLQYFLRVLRLEGMQAREDAIQAISHLSQHCVTQWTKHINEHKKYHLKA